MEEQTSLEEFSTPIHVNTFAFPNEPDLRLVHELYRPSENVKKLERRRTIFPELFIENYNLGTLADLSVRCLARAFGPDPLPIIADDPLKLMVHYDSLDIDMPLNQCCHITSERFWKRLVLNKHPDKSLSLQSNINWKNLGISLKLVEMVEACPAEYWPAEEMSELLQKIQEFVLELHIKRLQSLMERSFEKYFSLKKDSSTTEEDDDTNDEITDSPIPTSEEGDVDEELKAKTESQIALAQQLAEEKEQRKIARQILRQDKANARQEKEERRLRREARRHEEEQAAEELKKKKKKKNKLPKSVFEIEISESEDDGEQFIVDRRNLELYLKHKRGYNYPAEHCHHIDLRFVQHLKSLTDFTLEFSGPLQGRQYHQRHYNFSHEDIKNLAYGISLAPQLRIFRLRNSRMDAEKLLTLIRGLKHLEKIESVDFGYDQLMDDCGNALYELFENTQSIRGLELESNQLGEETLRTLGETLSHYTQGTLEYLGLARNPINDDALHALISNILGTPHISSLNLRGITYLSEDGFICCVAHELLRQHSVLMHLDITAIPIGPKAADQMMLSLNSNEKILNLDYLACGLDEETEQDIAVILKRNKFIIQNPYIGDQTKTDEDIDEWLNTTTNPILLRVLAKREKQKECLSQKPKEFVTSPQTSPLQSQESFKLETDGSVYGQIASNSEYSMEAREPFVYESNQFDEKEFLQHLYLPGPKNRYYHFKTLRD
ncbi:uncharacterized protein LOC101887845 [Musca domestica]|uniref:Uncharacterized protein LOC101887845 n=1 Tax=Musca domestica TaxID=7370 RepID=A0A1I8N451_MUSDO|nr:uncharacterized protein LOC101887845 [Musca domestica]